MTTATVRSGFDTWLYEAKASRSYSKSKFLRLDASGSAAKALVYFAIPAPPKANVVSATLTVKANGPTSGARTLTASRVTSAWKVSQATWNKQPTVTATGAATVVIGTVADGEAIAFDVTAQVQAMVNGAANNGFMLSTSTSTAHSVYGIDAGGSNKPFLTVVWSDAPATPTTLNPSGGAVSTVDPILQFDYTDVSGNTTLTAVHVQIDEGASGVSPDFDSGTVTADAPQLDLAATAFTGFTGTETFWRVRVMDGAGLWSSWSDWASVTYEAQTDPVITNPSGGVVYEVTPPILWTSTGQTAYQVLILDAANAVRHDSGRITGSDTSYTLPVGVLVDSSTYKAEVRTWDNVVRRATPGAPTFGSAMASFVVSEDAGVGPSTGLTATPVGPAVVLNWARSTAPDGWTVYEDGVAIAADLAPADTLVSGTAHAYTVYTARPLHEHTYEVRAVVNGSTSEAGTTATATTAPEGIRLVDPDDGVAVTLWGVDEGSWTTVDDASVYAPINSTEVVRIVSGVRGLEGAITGLLMEGFGQTFTEQETALYTLKSRTTARLRMITADVNMEVLVGDVNVSPKPFTRAGQIVKAVSFAFWQVGTLP